jgi:cyclohexanecarboxyl-CoA dehydrogenase
VDYGFSDIELAIKEAADRFAEGFIKPGAREREKQGRLEKGLARRMGEAGLLTPTLPSENGGLGVTAVAQGFVMEAIGYNDLGISYLPVLASLCSQILQRVASTELQTRWLPRIANGEDIFCFMLTEPHAGSDAARVKLSARNTPGGFLLTGEKASISMANCATMALVVARTEEGSLGHKGVSCFLVPMNSKGVTVKEYADLGGRANGRASIFFDDVFVPTGDLVGSKGGAFTEVMAGFDYTRALIGLAVLAAARAAIDETWQYAHERTAFGQAIAEFQGLAFPLVEFEARIEACRLLCLRTLWKHDQGLPHGPDSAQCKALAPRLAVDAIRQCMLSMGHAAYSDDWLHEKRLRDVLGFEIAEGTEHIMKRILMRNKTVERGHHG